MPPHNEVEQELRQSRESLEFALQSGRMGTWDINLENMAIKCSQEMLALWGLTIEEFTNDRKVLQKKVHPEDVIPMNEAINAAILNGSIYEMQFRIFPKPGQERWVTSRGRCTFDHNSNKAIRFSGVVFDITESKRKEEELKNALRARDQFFMVASHELRTPLTCLNLQFQVAEWELKHNYQDPSTPEKLLNGLRKQKEQLIRITQIVDNILEESKISEGRSYLHYEEVDLCELVEEVLDRFKVASDSHGVQIHFHNGPSILGIWDRVRLEQVLLNLLTNAIRYGNKNPIIIEARKKGDQAHLIVTDFGVGIGEEDQSRIFNRFEKINHPMIVNGMGLGLYISNNIVQEHGGNIQIKSVPGKGSEFTVIIPCTP